MTHDGREPDVADELDRLRLALLHERSRAEHAEQALATLRAEVAERDDVAAVEPSAPERPARRWRR